MADDGARDVCIPIEMIGVSKKGSLAFSQIVAVAEQGIYTCEDDLRMQIIVFVIISCEANEAAWVCVREWK